jgi:uncharacterized phage protein (TIGR02218 family)
MVPIGLGPTPRFLGVFGRHQLIAGAKHNNGSCDFIYVNTKFTDSTDGDIDIWKINITNGMFINSTVSTIRGFDYFPDLPTYHYVDIPEVEYDVTHNAVLIWMSPFDSLSPRYIMSANFDGTVNWVVKPPVVDAAPSAYSPGRSNLVGNTLMLGGQRSFQIIDTSNGQLLFSGAPVNLTNIIGFGAFYRNYDASTMSYYAYALSAGQARVKFFPPLPTQTFRVPQEYIAFATCCDRAIMAHLYQFTSVLGTNDYFTDFDIDIFYNGVIWKASSLRFEGLQRKIGVGLSVDEQSLKIWASPTDTMFGAKFLTGAEEGLLDGAIIVRKRAIWEFHSGNVASDIQHNPLAVWTLFTGYTSSIAKGGASHIELKVKSSLLKLNVNMPRNYYQPGCLWTLFDHGCSLNKSSYGVDGTVLNASKRVINIAGGISPNQGADGISYFAQGRLLFTSGVNNGLQVLIDNNDNNGLYLAYPLNAVPSAGDTVTFYPGCSKSYNTCKVKFNNWDNFRGFDKVPPVVISV